MSQPWWSRSVAVPTPGMSRRQALDAILAACGLAATTAYAPETEAETGLALPPEVRIEDRALLEVQRQLGWSFGAETEDLTFDGASTRAFDPAALADLAEDLRPASGRHTPFYVPTLFQSPWAVPIAALSGDAAPIVPLERVLRPIHTREMAVAYERGRALASLFDDMDVRAAIVVDLPGPEAVAFAAGASRAGPLSHARGSVLDPVFLFDNWPHPRGVVPAHLTLAAAAYYQPLFARRDGAGDRADALPMFVLDRSRLAAYVDDEAGFDNRHLARMPSADALRAAGVGHVLYVAPTSDALELDDLNEDFVDYAATAIEVRVLGADAFSPEVTASPLIADRVDHAGHADRGGGRGGSRAWERGLGDHHDHERYHYGGHRDTHVSFWSDYPWAKATPHHPTVRPPSFPRPGASYVPALRLSQPSREGVVTTVDPVGNQCGSSTTRRARSCVGHVQVLVSVATGAVLAAAAARSGTLGRVHGGSGG